MSPAPIAGPRRARPTTLPPEPTEVPAAPVPPALHADPAPPDGEAARALVPLDYDEMRGSSALPARPPRRPVGVRWFAVGIALGAVAAVLATGEAGVTLRGAREWGANALRSLEHKPVVATGRAPAPAMDVATSRVPLAKSQPCPMEPGPGDPCSALLAPFGSDGTLALAVPTVQVEDLPRVKPPAPAVAPRARASTSAGPAVATTPATTAAQEPMDVPPRGINPDAPNGRELDSPMKIAPAPVTPGLAPPGVDQASAANDPI